MISLRSSMTVLSKHKREMADKAMIKRGQGRYIPGKASICANDGPMVCSSSGIAGCAHLVLIISILHLSGAVLQDSAQENGASFYSSEGS